MRRARLKETIEETLKEMLNSTAKANTPHLKTLNSITTQLLQITKPRRHRNQPPPTEMPIPSKVHSIPHTNTPTRTSTPHPSSPQRKCPSACQLPSYPNEWSKPRQTASSPQIRQRDTTDSSLSSFRQSLGVKRLPSPLPDVDSSVTCMYV